MQQSAYRVLVATSTDKLREGIADVWDSGVVGESAELKFGPTGRPAVRTREPADLKFGPTVRTRKQATASAVEPFVVYAGPALQSRTRYYWSVRVSTADGAVSAWSAPAWFETALLQPHEWKARWIAGPERRLTRVTPAEGAADDRRIRAAGEFCRPPGWPATGFFPRTVPNPEGECRELRPAPLLRTAFAIDKPVVSARIYASGLGYHDLSINGAHVSANVLDPGFTDYSRTVLYVTHDVSGLLRDGENVVAAELGAGQYDSSTRTWDWGWDIAEWRATPRLLVQLHIRHADGTEQVVVSDDKWKVSLDGPRRYDSYYLGETYDARREIPGWNTPGFDASRWAAARPVDAPAGQLRAQEHEPIRVVATRPVHPPRQPSPGVFVYDIGQNLSGWARIRVSAPKGTAVELFYSEKLDAGGRPSHEVGYALVGGPLQTDYYIARGAGAELWTPRFSYKGFQYLQISAPGGQPLPANVSVHVEAIEQIRSALETTSKFDTGNRLLNRIHGNTRWAVESNLHGVVTDTPIYEKNPWTGDAQLSAGVIATLFDAERLYRKLAGDMADAQNATGEVPLLAPSNEHYGYVGKPAFKPADCCGATPAWDAFWFVLPWEAYQRHGDGRILAKTYPLMQRYLDTWIPRWTARDGDRYAHTLTAGLGDWDPPEGTPTNIALSSTAYYAHFAQIARDVAQVLDQPADAARYDALFRAIRADFNARFLSPDGIYRDKAADAFSQTAQVLPLAFGLAPDEVRDALVMRIADDIKQRGGNAFVGILGARYILPVLSAAGYTDLAYTVATQTDYPSWGHWIEELGWTGLGEYWEHTSRSRNHHFFGTIVQWMYEDLAGMRPLEPGYRRIEFRPEAPAQLEHVSASYESVRGTVATTWRRTREGVELEVVVPPNATGRVYVPGFSPAAVMESGGGAPIVADKALGVKYVGVEGDRIVYDVGSGRYVFRTRHVRQ